MLFQKPEFEQVMARLKTALAAKSYAEIGREIGLSTSAWANRKRANSIPYEEIIPLARSRSISLEWLFFGEGVAPAKATSSPIRSVDTGLLAGIFVTLRNAFWDRGTPAPKEALIEAGQLGSMAGLIYNRIANIESEAVRDAALRAQADELAHISKVLDQGMSIAAVAKWFPQKT